MMLDKANSWGGGLHVILFTQKIQSSVLIDCLKR